MLVSDSCSLNTPQKLETFVLYFVVAVVVFVVVCVKEERV